ncbi:MAG: type I methionyl aminopeptidase [Rickettsiales bacterium]|nr:type I methionyl aminopeptidase [Pseudomonadota bacterium]MDA0966954.1 type I methionyl aminopeptidase [Pseudomonadota bacterium]MDG4543873.1 type I methionyl aminopeptidase [Rickettsiales bacterium]MDG4546019.1 type I methionyl aminopeptidase [Rickettsiales bacterium]MDG4548265.1 type I methionyl aminopeptidase [Rickettsiales bacterium]
MAKEQITIHTNEDFESMRKAGNLAARVLDYIVDYVQPGVTTNELNDLCHKMTVENGAESAPLGYKGFPKSICTSVNHVVCHGIPSDKKLKDGDIVNIDVTAKLNGWHGDTSRMFFVGEPSIKAKRLCQVTYDAMMLGIEKVKPGNTLGDIGHAIQTFVEKHNYSVVRDYCGHGLGKIFHTAPSVMHFGKAGEGMVLEEGMFFTIEPMVNAGGWQTTLSGKDGWTVWTKDKSLSAQFEHSLAVTSDGFELFTESPKGLHCPPYK